jgi:hypothetical protein
MNIYFSIYIAGFALVLGLFGIPQLVKGRHEEEPIDPSVWIAIPVIAFIWPIIAAAFLTLAVLALLFWLVDL